MVPSSSLHDCLGRVRRVKAKPLRGRFASLPFSLALPNLESCGKDATKGYDHEDKAAGHEANWPGFEVRKVYGCASCTESSDPKYESNYSAGFAQLDFVTWGRLRAFGFLVGHADQDIGG